MHAGLFALLTVTAGLRFGPRAAVLISVVAYAPASELAQAFGTATRSGDAADVLADLTGVLTGWAWLVRRGAPRRAPRT